MAISVQLLNRKPLFRHNLGDQHFVVLTDSSGANRVYEAGNAEFVDYDRDSTLKDSQGNKWMLFEDRLEFGNTRLKRLPAHRAFWFGWYAAYPDTRLIK